MVAISQKNIISPKEYHRLDGLTFVFFFFYTSGCCMFTVKFQANLISGETSLPGLYMVSFSEYPHKIILLCICGTPVCCLLLRSTSNPDTLD